MSVNTRRLIIGTLIFVPFAAHAGKSCAERLTGYKFSPALAASAIEQRIDTFKSDPQSGIEHLVALEAEINTEFRRVLTDLNAARADYRQDFSLLERLNPLHQERAQVDALIDRVDRHLDELRFYHQYITDLIAKMANGQRDFAIFDWRRGYPLTASASYRPSGTDEDRALELAVEKSRRTSVSDPEAVIDQGPGAMPSSISALNPGHEAIQNDWASGDYSSFSNGANGL